MNGLRGLPRSASSCTSEWNSVPDGSRPTRSQSSSPGSRKAIGQANSFEILWIEERVSAGGYGRFRRLAWRSPCRTVGWDLCQFGNVVSNATRGAPRFDLAMNPFEDRLIVLSHGGCGGTSIGGLVRRAAVTVSA